MKNFSILITVLAQFIYSFVSQTIECQTDNGNYVDISKFPNYKKNKNLVQEDLCSYSGFIPNENQSQEYFYWYFPSISILPLDQIPIVVYINGFLGESTIQPIFAENGPLEIQTDKNNNLFVTDRLDAWTNYMSVIYLDIQGKVGFNNGELITDLQAIGADLTYVLKQLQVKLPNQQMSLYARSFGAKIALNVDLKELNMIILDNPLIDTIVGKSYGASGALGLGVYGPEYEDEVQNIIIKCSNSASVLSENTADDCLRLDSFYSQLSGLDSQDVRQNNDNEITRTMKNVDTLFQANLANIADVLNLGEFVGKFQLFSSEAYKGLSPSYGLNYTSILTDQLNNYNISMFYGEFNVANGPMGGYVTMMNALNIDYTQFPQKHKYSTGIMSIQSGIKMGYYYDIVYGNTFNRLNFFTLNQGAYQNTWLNQSAEIVYNMATNTESYCYTYNQRSCLMDQDTVKFMNNCNGNGKWNQQANQCVCDDLYAFADCSQPVEKLTEEGFSEIMEPRQWYFFMLEIDQDIQLAIGNNLVIDGKKFGILDIYLSTEGPAMDSYGQVAGIPYQIGSSQNYDGVNRITLAKEDNISVYYLSIRNSLFTEAVNLDIQINYDDYVYDSGWASGTAGYVISIATFSVGCLFVAIGGLKFVQIFTR